jgi:hypothetical protein
MYSDADDIRAATIKPTGRGSWHARIFIPGGTIESYCDTRAEAHDWLIRAVYRMDNPQIEESDHAC